jgi:hypothetical protein
MNVQPTLSSRPEKAGRADAVFSSLVLATDACFDCAHACRACADACLGEEKLAELRSCIELCLDCADVCFATGDLMIRHCTRAGGPVLQETGIDERIMELMFKTCAEVCRCCEEKCMRHAEDHKQCLRCAGICRSCAHACFNAAQALKVRSAEH